MAQLQLFELHEVLENNGIAKATLLHWDGERYLARGGKQILVHSHAGSHGVPGDRGYCFLGDSNCWEVVGPLVSEQNMG